MPNATGASGATGTSRGTSGATQQPTITGGPDTAITAANLQDPEIKKSFLISLHEVQTPRRGPHK